MFPHDTYTKLYITILLFLPFLLFLSNCIIPVYEKNGRVRDPDCVIVAYIVSIWGKTTEASAT